MKTTLLVVVMLAGLLMAGTASRVTATCWTCEGDPNSGWWCESVQGSGYLDCDPNGEVWCKLSAPSYCETNPCPGCRKFPALRLPQAYVVILDAPAEARESVSSSVRVVDVVPGDLGQLGQICEAIVSRGAHPPVDPAGASIAGYAIISPARARELRFRSSEVLSRCRLKKLVAPLPMGSTF